MSEGQATDVERLCGPCFRGQHGVCDGGFYLRCECPWSGHDADNTPGLDGAR